MAISASAIFCASWPAISKANFSSSMAALFSVLYLYICELPTLRVFFMSSSCSSLFRALVTCFWLMLLFSAISFLL